MLCFNSFPKRLCRNLSTQIHNTKNTNLSPITTNNNSLRSLIKLGHINEARKVFDEMPQPDIFTWNTMLAGYANSGKVLEARQLFDKVPNKNSVTWSSLISGYCNVGYETETFFLFYEMLYQGCKPSEFTLGSVLRLCSIKRFVMRGEQVHGYSVKTGFDLNVFVITGLIDLYAKCMRVGKAEYLFCGISKGRNHVTWTAMLNGYSLNGDAFKAIECFRDMRGEGVEANQYTFPGVLAACADVSDLRFGSQVHGCVCNGGFGSNVFVQSALIDMYTKCGDLGGARKVLDSMEAADSVSWNAMIVGYVRHDFPNEALSLFQMMRKRSMELDDYTYPSVLNSLSMTKDLNGGLALHCLIIKSGFESFTLVNNALIDMYAKQSNIVYALKLFSSEAEKDIISWTSLITGYAHNSSHEESLDVFFKMRVLGVGPDKFIAASVLSSCSELAWLDLGIQIHANSIKSGHDTSLSVNNALVSLYANCGCLENARKVFNSIEVRNVISWTALIIGNAQNGEEIESIKLYNEMIASGMKPDSITFIGLLFACSHGGLTECGRYFFESMVKDHGIEPSHDHYACMIDLLTRCGEMEEAEGLLCKMPMKPDSTVWKTLLAACRVHKNVDLAKKAANALIELEPEDSAPYVLLSNVYSSVGKWEEAASVRRLMESRGVGKEIARSWL